MLVGVDSCLDPAKVLYDQNSHSPDTLYQQTNTITATHTTVSKMVSFVQGILTFVPFL